MTGAPRVLVLNERDPLHPQAGGAEVHVAEISKRLAAMGFELTQLACGFRGGRPVEQVDGLTVRRLGPLPLYYPRAVATTAWETRRGRFDVVVEHLNKVPFCARAYSSAPVIAVNHHLFGRSAFLQVPWPVAATVVAIEKLIPLIYRRMPFLAVSESSKLDLVRRGVAAERIGLIHNGIVFPQIETKAVTERPRRVAYLGRLEPYKRVGLLLRAVARLSERLPDVELVLVGRGSEQPALERLAAELGIAERTRFTGFVSDAERDAALAASRVCACPSVKEGWGITVIEANALGVPVVATDAPGLRDAVRHGETGLLVADGPDEDFVDRLVLAIHELMRDDALAVRLSDAARAWARRFDWDTAADRMADGIRSVLTPGASEPAGRAPA